MNETLEKMIPLLAATVIGWLCVTVIALLNIHVFVSGGAMIMALFFTMVMWTMWALDQYGIDVDGTSHKTEKPKREDAVGEDARTALLLALLTPDERDALKMRLADELRGDGETITLADLLDDQDMDDMQAGRSS